LGKSDTQKATGLTCLFGDAMASVYYLGFVYMYLIWRSHRLLTIGVLDEDTLLGCSACLFPLSVRIGFQCMWQR
ncbi:hypothetical protein MUO98_08395, partial [Candidatus Bathyarchaeota archaeon]|nr:hypothetical protein [Candidatus Bathyarchaeota archaeon]